MKYSTTKKELLAIVFALKKFRHYLLGKEFDVLTDHKSLVYLFHSKNPSSVMERWSETLLEFSGMNIIHLLGIENVLPDYLSRIVSGDEPNMEYKAVGNISKEQTMKEIKDEEEKKKILEQNHLLGHFNAESMIRSIKDDGYFWKGMWKDAKEIVDNCNICRKYNLGRRGFHPLNPVHAERPLDQVCIDLAAPLPSTLEGHRFILIMVDTCTRFTWLRPLQTKKGEEIAARLIEIFSEFGFPKILSSDQGKEFVNSIIKKLKNEGNFNQRVITPYHPRANGTAERFVQTSMQILKKYIAEEEEVRTETCGIDTYTRFKLQ